MRRFWISVGFSVLTAVILSMCLFASAEVYSGNCGANGDNVRWELDTETGVLTISGEGEMEDYSFASAPWYSYGNSIKTASIEDGVTSIGADAFGNCTSLTSIIIPDSVTSIGRDAFRNCTSLTSINIPSNVNSIGWGAFEYCISLKSVYINDISSWCKISFDNINSNPLTNGCDLYLNSALVTELRISEDVANIKRAFYNCNSLTSVYTSDSMNSIDEYAFYGCDNLTSVYISKSVTTIGGDSFSGCDSLTCITVAQENEHYSSDENGVLFNKDKTTLIQYPAGNTASYYRIPNGVEYIAHSAFKDCVNLVNIEIPYGVLFIGNDAFMECTNLSSLYIPRSVISIGDFAFGHCDSLTSLTFQGEMTNEAYSIVLPSCVTVYGIPGGMVEALVERQGLPFVAFLPGTIINQYLHTDIKAIIDEKVIRSYNIDGNTAIIVEDLAAYGFNVVWDGENRTLSVAEGDKLVKDGFEGEISAGQVGTPVGDVLYTDIKTYVNGKQVTSYNIGGMTAIQIDDLAVFGNVKWDGTARTISFSR